MSIYTGRDKQFTQTTPSVPMSQPSGYDSLPNYLQPLVANTKLRDKYNIPNYLGEMVPELKELGSIADKGLGSSFIYDTVKGNTAGQVAKLEEQETSALSSMGSKFGSAGLSLGARGRLSADFSAQKGMLVGQATMQAMGESDKARTQAIDQVINLLLERESSDSQLSITDIQMWHQKDQAMKELSANSGGCALAAAMWGPFSDEEKMFKIWEKMHIRLNRGSRIKRRMYWQLFRGYHYIAPKIVATSKYGYLRTIREWITGNFGGYVTSDIFLSRKTSVSEKLAACIVGIMSYTGWLIGRLRNG